MCGRDGKDMIIMIIYHAKMKIKVQICIFKNVYMTLTEKEEQWNIQTMVC